MTEKKNNKPKTDGSRRDFIKNSSLIVAGGVVGSNLSIAQAAHNSVDETIRIGLIGCGGRGTGAAIQAMNTKGPTQLVAMGDVFEDRLANSFRSIKGKHGEKVKVVDDTKFVGLDAYKKVLETDIDIVILATPPGFRPTHFEAAINANKHVFMEKPVATDGPGIRKVLEAAKKAKEKSRLVQVGLQRRHERAYMATIEKLHDGMIGDIHTMRVYWNGAGVWVRPRNDKQTELEYQMRNWYYFNWLCGDHITEQHIHNLDVGNWVKKGFPVKAQGQGGREVRTGLDNGHIYDHHFIEYTYEDGSKMFSQCRHQPGTWRSVSEHCQGANGYADISGGKIFNSDGKMKLFDAAGLGRGGHQQEHHDLFADLRAGKIPNEAEYGAKSTLTAILGRMCSYTGKEISFKQALNSDLALADFAGLKSMKDEAPVKPDEELRYAIPTPGKDWDTVL